ncbi:LYR motif-containing protein 4 isoform X1 [Phyllobates terribilis]|uniref:LYR motif-containing protein 4 isoform X1 n=1 Tax=Phyllobates terribilis TaxID=111132 RepID=UPI003CCADE78
MASSSRTQVLSLYKVLLRESQKFNSYNYRTYAIRRVRDAFREKKNVDDFHEIQSLMYRAKENLEVIQRQVPFVFPPRHQHVPPVTLVSHTRHQYQVYKPLPPYTSTATEHPQTTGKRPMLILYQWTPFFLLILKKILILLIPILLSDPVTPLSLNHFN